MALHLFLIVFHLTSHLPAVHPKVFATQMSPRVVETQYGKLRGVLVTLSNRNLPQVEAYLGLQYASLLGGELRFMPPTSTIEKWDGIRVALKYRPVCPQRLPSVGEMVSSMPKTRVDHFRRVLPFLERQQEECLNLNIYVPVRERGDSTLLPVVVFLHGETYDLGSGNAYDGSALSAYGQVIVVTINYRLGILGFLSTGDGNAPGNYALLDQIAALRWIQENIRPFGGNKNDVTLLGHGHGAVMVNLLMISPVTKGRNLFQRAIVQSGSALSPWATVENPLVQALAVSTRLNCSSNGIPSAILQCLKRFSVDQLVSVSLPFAPLLTPAFGPTVDRRSVLLSDIRASMEDMTSDSAFANVSLMVGFASGEAVAFFNDSVLTQGLPHDTMQDIVGSLVNEVFSNHQQTIFEVLLHQYRDWDSVLDEGAAWNSLVDLLSDALFAIPAFELGLYHAAAGASRTFLYCFNFTTGRSRTDAGKDLVSLEGAAHGFDLTYIFGAPITDGIDPFPAVYAKAEKSFTETLLKYWINFIKTGSPNDPSSQQNVRQKVRLPDAGPEWPQFDSERQDVMILDARSHVRRHFRASRLALWLSLLPKIHRPDDPDDCNERGFASAMDAINHTLTSATSRRLQCSTASGRGTDVQTLQQRAPSLGGGLHPPVAAEEVAARSLATIPPAAVTVHHRRQLPVESSSAERRPARTTPTLFVTSTRGSVGGRVLHSHTELSPTGATDHGLALVIVIFMGCVLLAVNVLLFACVYRRKFLRWRERRRKRRKAAMDEAEEKGELTEQSYSIKGSGRSVASGPDCDRCSHYLTPIPSHHHLYCQMTSLQNSFHTSP